MGFDARQVDSMSLWEFTAAVDGYAKANGAEQQTAAPSYDEHLEMVARLAS